MLLLNNLQPKILLGGYTVEGTPLPIPNRVVKFHWADDTAWVTAWESR